MIDHGEKFRNYLSGFLKTNREAIVLQLKISLIDENLRQDAILLTILNNFYNVLEGFGQAFCLKNDDIFVLYSTSVSEGTIKAALIRTWLNFSGDPQTTSPEKLLEVKYYLPEDLEALTHEVSRISKSPSTGRRVARERKKFIAPIVHDDHKKPFTPEMLARVTKALKNTDFSSMIRRQSVCIILDDAYPQPLFEEIYVSINDLGETILPGFSLTGTPWLFQDLTETLDKRVLNSISCHDDGDFTHAFSLNLNISTILSQDFQSFNENIRSYMKNTIVLEVQPIDIFSDLKSFLMARDYAQSLGYKMCVDSVTADTLKLIDREKLSADYLKLIWSPDLPVALQEEEALAEKLLNIGQNRAILCRVDDAEALRIAKTYNITLFQGRYIQRLISHNPRNRRIGAKLLRY